MAISSEAQAPACAEKCTGVASESFKAVFRHHPAGVAVVSFCTAAGPAGFTASSVIPVSVEPAAVAFSVAAGSTARRLLDRVASAAVNLLAEDQTALAVRFAARGVDRFADVDWSPLPTGEPVVVGARSWLRGTVERRVPVGSSLLVVLLVTEVAQVREEPPLVYEDRTFRRLGEPTFSYPCGAR